MFHNAVHQVTEYLVASQLDLELRIVIGKTVT